MNGNRMKLNLIEALHAIDMDKDLVKIFYKDKDYHLEGKIENVNWQKEYLKLKYPCYCPEHEGREVVALVLFEDIEWIIKVVTRYII